MTAIGPALPCPSCRRTLASHMWHDDHAGRCGSCTNEFEFFPFPALTATKVRVAPQAVEVAEESVCFFHAENRAETVCDECGRMLCAVCAITFAGRRVCPTCIAGTKTSDAAPVVKERVLYDSLALAIALLPLLLWPFTLVTAPAALGFTLYGWNKPNSLVRGRSRGRLIAAGVMALVQIGGWVWLGIVWWLKP